MAIDELVRDREDTENAKRILDHLERSLEPTPPSQIEEEPKRTLAQAISDPEFMDRVVKEWAQTMVKRR